MTDEDRESRKIAYGLAKGTVGYLDAVIFAGSGKGPEQHDELSDIEGYAANILLMIAVNKVANYFQLDPSVLHLMALAEFWGSVYSQEEIMSLQNHMIDEFNRLLVSDKDIVENIGSIFWELSQKHDAQLVEELAGIYRMWVDNLSG